MSLQARTYELTGLDAVKDYLGITGESSDNNLMRLILAATDYIEGQLVGVDTMEGGYCNRRFFATDYTSALYSGCNFRDLFLRQYPINSVTTIVIDDTTEFPSGASSLNDLNFYIDVDAAGNLIYTDIWPIGDNPQNIQITYNAGYSAIPWDLQGAVTAMVANRFSRLQNNAGAFKSEKIGNYSYTLQDLTADNPFGDGLIKDMFDKYRKPMF